MKLLSLMWKAHCKRKERKAALTGWQDAEIALTCYEPADSDEPIEICQKAIALLQRYLRAYDRYLAACPEIDGIAHRQAILKTLEIFSLELIDYTQPPIQEKLAS